ncbi:unnamed protein product [Triticum turgidum subsp. durum]|uniref:Uncharacterized protein n=1 Tax=Triticum turgidum subsp. durum TaxID=4567 RepID=A0A9R0R224_TRITD|nr:unnamed protein product [Triticum turgidum subsp. durum]
MLAPLFQEYLQFYSWLFVAQEATFEVALCVKEAQKQCFLEETEHDCGSFQNGLDESDWLAELTEIGMLEIFEDVGLSTVQTTCSSQGINTTNLEQR